MSHLESAPTDANQVRGAKQIPPGNFTTPCAAFTHPAPTLEHAWLMLQFIPAFDRDIWLRIGMALKAAFGEVGFSVWDQWSQTADNYNAKAVASAWRSFRGKGVAFGSLVFLAQQYGWRADARPIAPVMTIAKKPPPTGRDTATYAFDLFKRCGKDDSFVMAHPYAIKKGFESAAGGGRVIASGSVIGKNADCLIAPIRNIESGRIQGVQCINTNGAKQTFGSVAGGALILGNTLDKSLTWYVAEGWASAYSMVFHHPEKPGNHVCACSFGKHNQRAVAQKIDKFYSPIMVGNLLEQD